MRDGVLTSTEISYLYPFGIITLISLSISSFDYGLVKLRSL